MAKKQTRRSISVRGTTYYRLREYCDGLGVSMSDFVEQRIAEHMEAAGFRGTGTIPEAAPRAAAPRLAVVPAAHRFEPRVDPKAAPKAERPIERAAQKTIERFTERLVQRQGPAPVVPATSTLNKKPQPVAAMRASAPAPAQAEPLRRPEAVQPVGRPAPTPAGEVIKDRYEASTSTKDDKSDYRAIRF